MGPAGMRWVMKVWVGHEGVGWVMQGWGMS